MKVPVGAGGYVVGIAAEADEYAAIDADGKG